MSEGVEQMVLSEAQFWADRWHYVIEALVAAEAGDVDKREYEGIRDDLVREGFSKPVAADLAFRLRSARFPSACEVNPW